MNKQPDSKIDQAEGISRRSALKRAAGAGIIMSSLTSGSALASISCKKFSNWMSGRLNGGSPGRVDDNICTLGRSPGFWSTAVSDNSCSPALENNFPGQCNTVKNIYKKAMSAYITGGSSQKVGYILTHSGENFGKGINVDRAFCAAYLNTRFIPGYPLSAVDLANLYAKIGQPGFDHEEIKDYLESTYSMDPN